MSRKIKEFKGVYEFLSNFYPAEVEYESSFYPTSEHAYQAAKSLDISVRKKISELKTPGNAKRAGSKVQLRPDWEQVKVQVMTDIVRDKFKRNNDLKQLLLDTGQAELQENNSWNDRFWGMVNGVGRNMLGNILMQVRDEIREEDKLSDVEVVSGDLLEAPEQYILHQINCVTTRAAHLAKAVFKKFPWADVYSPRDPELQRKAIIANEMEYAVAEGYQDTPGDILIRGNGQDKRYVIGILGQVYPGKPRYPESKVDGYKARERCFYQGMLKVKDLPGLKSIAFPYGIGCGAAAGNWETYQRIINNFSKALPEVDVKIYKL